MAFVFYAHASHLKAKDIEVRYQGETVILEANVVHATQGKLLKFTKDIRSTSITDRRAEGISAEPA